MESSQDPPPFPPQRTRARSNSIRGENPLETPISPADHQLARLGASINVHNARRQSTSLASRSEFQQAVGAAVNASREDEERSRQRRAALITSGGYSGLPIRSGAQRSSDSESGFFAPQSEPFERSKTPTQDDYRAQQSANSRDLLPGNRAFRVNSLQRPQYPSLVGTQTQPQARAKSSSASDQGRSNAPLPALQRGQQTYPLSRPPIPTLVERPFVLQGRPAQSNPSGSSSSVSSLPNPQPNLRQDFPVRHISHITPNPARQTPQVSTPIGLHPGRSASVGHWIPHDRTNPSFGEAFPSFTDDSGFEETTVEKGEPFPSFEEPSATEDVFPRYQEASNPERGTTAQGSESQEPSSIGRLIAKDRARSSSGSDSDDSDRTVIYRGPARESVNTLRLPIETDYIIFCVYNNLSFLLPKHLTHPVLFSEGSAREEISIAESDPFILASMSFQNYVDQPSGGAGSNPRQAPTSPSQGAPHTNGMNGGMGMGGGMVGYPTPAGHQSDLNYLMNMVEELSGVLALNQRLTNGVVEKMGKVREKAQNMNLSNDELLQLAAMELNDGSKNLERENSELRAALEKSDYDKKENFKLACHGANILADITEKMHAFKEQHEADTLAWHKNYRKQLAEEREENLRLRNQINDMIASAARANGHLRDMRHYLTDHDELHELRVQNVKFRQERRMWKRMALPLIPDDDSEWSNDDDLIDPEEKKRLAALAEKKKDEEAEGGGEGSAA